MEPIFLLEQILDAHPDVLAFDEPVAFSQEITSRINLSAGRSASTLTTLDTLPAARRTEMRQRYVKSLLREIPGEPSARVLLAAVAWFASCVSVRLLDWCCWW